MQEDRLYQIALSILFRNRIRRGLELLEHYDYSAYSAWQHAMHNDEGEVQSAMERAEREIEFVEQHHIQMYWCGDDDYPYRLRECPDRPLLLYSKGNVRFDDKKVVSIVGTRNATDRGKEETRKLVLDLAAKIPNIVIVSGLAYGIDIAAHRAAIEAGVSTVIVPGHGLDRIYPSIHRQTAVQSLENGGILTEYPSGTKPDSFNFVARNRIIAGLADTVVVMESKQKGGSLITAQMACDYNRDLFAYPGRVSDENAYGCNILIRSQKAQLIQSADDLIESMLWETAEAKKEPLQTEITDLFGTLSESQRTLIDKLHEQEDGMHINVVVMETQIPYAQASADLMLLEMQGLVKALPGGIYRALK